MKILMTSNYSLNNKRLFDLTIKNHFDYCSKFNIDMLNTISEYNPKNNFSELKKLFELYDVIITVGTDILFTNFNKDIREFNDFNKPLTIQNEGTYSVNGDFIFWNKTILKNDFINFLENLDKTNPNTQETINQLVRKPNKQLFHQKINILPPRTLQSICPYGNQNNKSIQNFIWKNGDFSIHAHRPGFAPNVDEKIDAITKFLNNQNLNKGSVLI